LVGDRVALLIKLHHSAVDGVSGGEILRTLLDDAPRGCDMEARNATVAEGQDAQSLAEFFDKHMAIHTPEMAATTIIGAAERGRAREVIGWEAKALDVLARTVGPAYQRVIATAVARFFPWAR
jgi:hypothetical protein